MENLQVFRTQVRELYRRTTPVDGRKPTQQDLAGAVGLERTELSKRLNGIGGAQLTPANVRAIVRTLAEWEAIRTQAEVEELLRLAGCPDFPSAAWQAPPLNMLVRNTPLAATT